ncbi:spore coat protein [Bacillus badius]|uniref:CotY/CotZ family spore coat protein n=1 Tax=Bacillus badius TaxID=1455 RepID=UPI001CBB4C91|nr:CotY/CotZ family spore coat protein [Bacillus badius]UAT29765.1 spore coat protein [Bacillus badius]
MGCGEHFHTGHCVCDILAEIAEYQQDTASDDCVSSCAESIRELVGGTTPSNFNTVPLQLICSSVNPTSENAGPERGGLCGNVFVAQGFRRNTSAGAAPGDLQAITTTFFRVSSVDTENCCAVLELLCAEDITFGPAANDLIVPPGQGDDCLRTITGPTFSRTRVCITVDLNCFCGVSCLPAVFAPSI